MERRGRRAPRRRASRVDAARRGLEPDWSFVDMRRYTSVSYPRPPQNLRDPDADLTHDTVVQEPGARSVWAALRRNFHWKCLVLSGMIETCIGVVVWCQLAHAAYTTFSVALPMGEIVSANPSGPSPPAAIARDSRQHTGPCDQGYNFIPIAFAIMLYVVYIMECWHCRTRLDLMCQVDVSTVYTHVEELRTSVPIVWWRALCYHYIRRTRQITRYRNGDAITTTQHLASRILANSLPHFPHFPVYYERVNSHSAGSVFLYHDCGVRDISKKLSALELFPVTKVRFSKGFVFANLQAANEFEEQRARFFQENEQRDDYMEVREGLDLSQSPFKETMIAFANPSRRPWYTSQWAFWGLSLVLLSWPLRVLLEYKTAYVHYQVTKLFGTNYLSPSSVNYTGPLTRASTMDSRELDAAMSTNYVIVPSYSEALLMDPVASHTHVIHDRQGNVHIETRQRLFRPALNPPGATQPLCNEGPVIANYGALSQGPEPLVYCSRSRSMSFARQRADSITQLPPPPPIAPLGLPSFGRAGSRRSHSYGNLRGLSRGYAVVPQGLERGSAAPEEPPPPYEVALQMCQPLVARLRRSASSLQRLARFPRSASRDATARKDDETLI